MTQRSSSPDTYVGDYFTLSFMKGDKEEIAQLDGQDVRLVGFNNKLKLILPHQLNALNKRTGVYRVLGDPLVRTQNNNLVSIPMVNLIPHDFRFSDNLPKNKFYIQELRKKYFISELPHIPYNVGDKVLVSQHSTINNDFVSEVLDIVLKGIYIRLLMCPEDKIIEVPVDKVIDVIEHSSMSDMDYLGASYRASELIQRKRVARLWDQIVDEP